MKQSRSSKKVANSLLAVSSAAVLAVYAAGYTRTQSAADGLNAQAAERRPAFPGAPRPAQSVPPVEVTPAAPVSAPDPGAKAAKPVVTASAKPVSTVARVAVDPVVPALPAASESVAPPSPVPAPAPKAESAASLAVAAAAPPWKDGTYDGWGSCRHGEIQATVVIEGGRIASARISDCQTRYSCDIIEKSPPQVVQRQSPEVDVISGATQSGDAYYWAVTVALGKAK